jgi:ATP-binding cassette subfamily B protein
MSDQNRNNKAPTPPRGPGGPRMVGMKMPTGGGKTLKRLFGMVFERYKLLLLIVLAGIIISALVNVASSMFMQTLIDDYITPLLLEDHPVFTGLLRAVLVMACIYLLGVLASFCYNRLMVTVAQGTLKRVRDEMFTKMQQLPIRYFDTHAHGDVMSRYTNDTDTLRQLIAMTLPQFISSAITVVAIFCAMCYYSLILTAVVIASLVVMMILTKKVGGSSARYFMSQQTSLGNLNGYIEEIVNGQKVVKVFCRERRVKEEFNEKNETLFGDAYNANRYGNVLMPIMVQINNVQYVLLAVVGGYMALHGVSGLTVGVLVAFLALSKSFSMPFNQMSQQVSMVAMALAGAQRIFDLMDEEPEENDGTVHLVRVTPDGKNETTEYTGHWAWKEVEPNGETKLTEVLGDIRLNGVDFGYEPDKQVLYDIDIFAKPGQKIAFVGHTGAGKTTITNLLNRFYDIQKGSITYDGIDISRINKIDLRHCLGVVLQDVNLFTGTVMDNIRYGKLTATDEECIAAAKLANAHEFIMHLPQGYETELTGDGGSLSQGQRQLISIARAAVADPPVMVLDEATSSIDTRTEKLVQDGMDALMKGRTVFVIAHRLSTIQNADAIIVLDHGHIIERGNHESLLAEKGVYYSLYTGATELD